jgi:hypothetical protein
MKQLYRLLISVLIVSINLYPQLSVMEQSETGDGIILHVKIADEPYLLEGEKKNIINFVSYIDESKTGLPILPSKTVFIAVPPGSKINVSLFEEKIKTIPNVIPRANPLTSLKNDSSLIYNDVVLNRSLLKSEYYPEQNFKIEGYTWIRNYYCAVIKLNTHRYHLQSRQITAIEEVKLMINYQDEIPYTINNSPSDDFEKALSKVILNFNNAQQFRSFPPASMVNDSTGNWIDYSKEYVKLQIPVDGIYRIDYNELINYQIPPGVNPKTFKIFYRGKEIDLFVSGENDSTLDPGDYIEFWGQKNYRGVDYRSLAGIGEEYLTFFDIYSDTSIVWLSWDGNFGKRVELVSNYVPGLIDTIYSHQKKIHLENDVLFWYYGFNLPRIQLPFWHECKSWVWLQATNTGIASFPFPANSIVPNTEVYTISRLNSWATTANLVTNAHKYGARLNNTITRDSVTFNFETIENLEATFNSNELISGTNNYRIAGMPNDSNFVNRVLVDWVDIDYYQYTNAVNDSLLISIPDTVSTGLRILKVGNYFEDIDSTVIYKIGKIGKRFSAFQIESNTLTFTDTVTGRDKYFIVKDSYLKSPVFLEKKQFVNLRNQSQQADYLLITHSSLQSSANDYAGFIETNYSDSGFFNVSIIMAEDIYDEFGYGFMQPEAIKEFVKYSYLNWQVPKPAYLVLLGDCTYDYKNRFILTPSQRKKILVPSYGNSVSDTWFTTFDTTNVEMQQMFVGRIPANNNEEVYRYLNKHQVYVQRTPDEWNKNFILFSGGFPDNPGEMDLIREANESIRTEIIIPPPVGGEAVHFYKTIFPPSNFGPYTAEEIQNTLDYGGLFISYIGHSGTRTWDNGVTEPSDLINIYSDRFPLVSDNGCSTGKIAEPDIDAFGELFLNQDPSGQAIAYFGNSSLGYSSTSLRMPELFYSRLIVDTSMNIGAVHFLSKMDNFNLYGFGDVNRLFNYCNLLLGDPVLKFASADKPNFVVNQNSVEFIDEFITDAKDSIEIKLILRNWGRVINDSLDVDIEGIFSDTTYYTIQFKQQSPVFNDTLELKIPVLGMAGEHTIKINVDLENLIDEVNELDNSTEITFNVYSTNLRPLESEYFYNSSRSAGEVLNPSIYFAGQSNEIEIAVSQLPDFTNQSLSIVELDSVSTNFNLTNLLPDIRYYWRARLNSPGEEWSRTVSFFNENDYSWFINHSFNSEDLSAENVVFDSVSLSWKIRKGDNTLRIGSAGFNDGKYASIQYNFLEYVPNTFFRGFATALIDTFDLHPYDVQSFMTPVTPSRDSLIRYLNYLDDGNVLAVAATDEVLTFFNGTLGDSLRELFRGFGSVYVDSIGFRDSWAIIGIKGAPQGSIPEAFSKSMQGPAIIDTSKFVQFTNGFIQFPEVTNAVKWTNVIKQDSLPPGSSINYYPIVYHQEGTIDTLSSLNFTGNEASIDSIDSEFYTRIFILSELNANLNSESPEIKSLAINFVPPPDLAINYQVVSLSQDSVLTGEDISLNFSVYNVGETRADSFNIKVELIHEDNSRETLLVQNVDSLSTNSKIYRQVSFNTVSTTGSKSFYINIDSENEVSEFYEDNNFYSIPFFIRPDTTTPSLIMTIDGGEILDGEYISPRPAIHIELTDQSLIPITDPSFVEIYLNDEFIPSDTSIVNYQFSSTNPKVVVDFNPVLSDGEYYLKILWKDSRGNIVDSSGVEKYFLVANEPQILNVYNYPNPFVNETHFTFKLTQIPEEIKIKIFTIAGRLVKEIIVSSTQLDYDFNKIIWDGKDEEGDLLANGVYLYKVIMKAGENTEDITQKLAIMR